METGTRAVMLTAMGKTFKAKTGYELAERAAAVATSKATAGNKKYQTLNISYGGSKGSWQYAYIQGESLHAVNSQVHVSLQLILKSSLRYWVDDGVQGKTTGWYPYTDATQEAGVEGLFSDAGEEHTAVLGSLPLR